MLAASRQTLITSAVTIQRRSLTAVPKLIGPQRASALAELASKGWKEASGRDAITKTFLFGDFKQAWRFMSQTAEYADKVDHHPEWFNVYNKVEVTLSTHDSSGVTMKDVDLATHMENYAVNAAT